MVENVTDIIVARGREPEGLKVMLVWSMAGHIALATVALLWKGPAEPPPREVMTISLGGAPGPDTGGKTQIGGQAVQAPAPPEQPKPVEAPPAAKPPVMSLPTERSRPRTQPKPAQAPPEATATTPNTGAMPREGKTRVRGEGLGTGLSSSGGSGGAVQLDVTNFCCQEYLDRMVTTIRQNWDQSSTLVGSTTMRFVIARDGTIQSSQVLKSSGFVVLDNAAMRALQLSRLPPLPEQFDNPTLGVQLRFDR